MGTGLILGILLAIGLLVGGGAFYIAENGLQITPIIPRGVEFEDGPIQDRAPGLLEAKYLVLLFGDGAPFLPDSVMIDGQPVAYLSNRVDISAFSEEVHEVTVTFDNLTYSRAIDFSENKLELNFFLERPARVSITLFARGTRAPIPGVDIFIEASKVCTTSSIGSCSFSHPPGRFLMRASGNGVSHEAIISISEESSQISIDVDRAFRMELFVLDQITKAPVGNAEIFIDGIPVGKSNAEGLIVIENINEGPHQIEARLKDSRSSLTVNLTPDSQRFEIEILAPRQLSLTLIDSETRKPITQMIVFLESKSNNYRSFSPTTDFGKVSIDDVLPGQYAVRLEGAQTLATPSTLITVGESDELTIELDMPNPRLSVAVTCSQQIGFLNLYGVCDVTVKNQDYDKALSSLDTIVVLLVYNEESIIPIDSWIVSFGNLHPGEELKLTSPRLNNFDLGQQETIVAAVFDGSRYTPEVDPLSIRQPVSKVEMWISDAIQELIRKCIGNPLRCINPIVNAFSEPDVV